jgi:hypothetical protein
MEIIEDFLEARLLADLNHNLLHGICELRKRLDHDTTTMRQLTENDTEKCENNQLGYDQECEISGDDRTIEFGVGQASHVLPPDKRLD